MGKWREKEIASKMDQVDTSNDEELLDTFFDATPEDVKHHIESIVETTVQRLVQDKEIAFSVIARTNSNAVYCAKDHKLRLKQGTIQRKISDGKRYQGMWKVLQICYALMISGKQLNQRELYYMNTDVLR